MTDWLRPVEATHDPRTFQEVSQPLPETNTIRSLCVKKRLARRDAAPRFGRPTPPADERTQLEVSLVTNTMRITHIMRIVWMCVFLFIDLSGKNEDNY